MIDRGINQGNIRVLGSHWNRAKVRSTGTGIHWNNETNKWDVNIVRQLGSFESAIEAAAILEKHLTGVEDYLIREYIKQEDRVLLPPTAIYIEETSFKLGKIIHEAEQERMNDMNGGNGKAFVGEDVPIKE